MSSVLADEWTGTPTIGRARFVGSSAGTDSFMAGSDLGGASSPAIASDVPPQSQSPTVIGWKRALEIFRAYTADEEPRL